MANCMAGNAQGHYLLKAEGRNAKGEKVAERPTRFILDGKEHPVSDFPGLSTVATRTAPKVEARRDDGSVAGGGTYVVSADGTLLTARARLGHVFLSGTDYRVFATARGLAAVNQFSRR
jgi:hypothetical protein